ncbi:peptidoglycan DD-metalloendopeptidase family protein [Lentimicrobium sp. L6]|uniref:urea transporter n=1 Tax=Lentimicrobium sp. L6 TaxID=2735916 RepID=UPI0015516DB9|nr:urea transporter [Lentimicrobium sp. L6]NPD85751.1 peptidoglycan DD-metalloendopeptidase family protein [Lentimicrobium sp. L6]
MEKNIRIISKEIIFTVLNSYSQVFFSTSKILAIVLLLISFFDYGAGIGGLTAVIIANILAHFLGYNEYYIKSGLFGFNSLLVGLGVGLTFQPSIELFLLIAIASTTAFFLTIAFQGVLGKYGLPFLSIPFLATIWIVLLAGGELTALNISERGIYTYNELYGIGGQAMVSLYDWLDGLISSSFLRIYFYSLGAIFFQKGLLAGILISLGLLIYSRITFVLSILGYTISYIFYIFVGIEFNSLSYTFIGFNYILTAIALGGYYLIPGRTSFAWIMVLLPSVVLITISTQQLFAHFYISPYSLPFNMVVLMFLYSLKLREKRANKLLETPIQLGNPEKNLYLQSGNLRRFPARFPIAASLPFFGEWQISQGHKGEITHKGAWQNAWDFVITDNKGEQYKGSGDFVEDYFCFGKAITAPFEGTVVEVVNSISDNTIGNVDIINNWGNTVIIKHSHTIFSKLCHLKHQSVAVKVGDQVKKGQLLGKCGNSGRSPYPHLHFQFQPTPYIGSTTLDYPIGHYLLKGEKYNFETFSIPQKGQVVANPRKNNLLTKLLHFIPGQGISGEFRIENTKTGVQEYHEEFNWRVNTDVFNSIYIESEEDHTFAYLYNNEEQHYFTNYIGKKETALYWFFLALFKVPLGFLPNSNIKDNVPINLMFGGVSLFLQDMIAPIYLFLKADYKLEIEEEGDILLSDHILLKSELTKKIAGQSTEKYHFKTKLDESGVFDIELVNKDLKIQITCQKN